MLKTTIDVTVEVEIACPPAEVWAVVSEAGRSPEWLDEFEAARVETEGPVGMGTVVRYTVSPGSRSGTYEIVGWEPGRRLAWDGPPLAFGGGAARPRGSFVLDEAGEGRTRFVARYQPELSGLQVLLAPYLKRWLRRRREADAATLKALLEAGEPS